MKAKNTLLLVLFLLCQRYLSAQFPSLPVSNTYWLMGYSEQSVLQYFYGYHLRLPEHDTLLSGLTYSSLWTGIQGQATEFAGGLRVDSDNRVYYFHPNSSAEYLLYDFDPNIGDSMQVWVGDYDVPSAPLTQMHIASIALSTNSNGTAYKRIGVLSDLAVSFGEMVTHYWIEGVGGTGGLLSTNGTSFTPLGSTGLVCMQHNDSIWPAGVPGLCSPMNVPENGSNGIVLFPNPTTGRFTCTFPEPHTAARTYGVYDALGHLLDQQSLPPGRNTKEIDLSRFGAGSYLIKVSDPKGVWHAKVMLE